MLRKLIAVLILVLTNGILSFVGVSVGVVNAQGEVSPYSDVRIGNWAVVINSPSNNPTSCNSTPLYTSSNDIGSVYNGDVLFIESGPYEDGGVYYWKTSGDCEGYVGDGQPGQPWLAPIVQPVLGNQSFSVGDQVKVVNSPMNDPLNCRANAGTNYQVVAQLTNGFTSNVTEGPVNNQSYVWIKLEQCWVAVGLGTEIWIERVNTSSSNSMSVSSSNTSVNGAIDGQQSNEQRYRLNDDEELQLKSQDDGKGRTLATIKGGDIVTVLELIDSNGMVIAKVRYSGQTGYVLFEIDGKELFQSAD